MTESGQRHSVEPLTHLGEIPVETFLRDYWQKKPLLIRNAFPDFEAPISGEELAGMALEEQIESRLIEEHGIDGPWQLRSGPFTEEDFFSLPKTHWTLLVQAVDQWIPEVAALKNHFRFLPDWRLDDIMISYAADQGSVGPHYDFYDVFLLQAEGKRHWHLGPKADASSPRVEGTPLNILREFESEASWVLEPGDMLYLPPQYSHWGIAEGGCTTISVGFRAPSARTMLEDLAAELGAGLPDHYRYTDPDLTLPANPSEIDPQSVARVQRHLAEWLQQPQNIAQWFGAIMTEAKYPDTIALDAGTAEDWREQLAEGSSLILNPGSRCAFCREPASLFVDGESFPAPLLFAEGFCNSHTLTQSDIEAYPELAASDGLLDLLVSQGSLIYPEVLEDDDLDEESPD
ncbi:cupin domain-containing protein [Microbulbifer hydrolyticus]|uniref:50S ribosomal protein L16 3-hydroxylase n=1 Tax=Microbulbifer hydrolyticus TaxID=48074 RepID=A0A6P1TEF9_9GAMM|nr:cupin domain-containing protein [Microbulbifer hydrolyticus]MBB5210367.1 50S ribosomal protein L16 3-hydroxylase [Microbulbifer hydrolyticus]QHQ39142.1 cupin domain-containing protein [Microbulbifer hydrolyticus]